MPQSLSAIYLHAVFSTRERIPFLDDEVRERAHAYLGGVSKNHGGEPIAVGGVPDHVHLLVRFGRTTSVADWLREVKRASSRTFSDWRPGFGWQAGYGVFSVDFARIDSVAQYVRDQEAHHRKESFQGEPRRILREEGVEFDERYLWE